MKTLDSQMVEGMNGLLQSIEVDYKEWTDRAGISSPSLKNLNPDYEIGSKYIKVTTTAGSQTTVWGFVVNTDNDKKFKKGDLLMAASWRAPARNFARGNLLENYKIRWTGTL